MDLQRLVVFDKLHPLQLSHETAYVAVSRANHFAKHFLRSPVTSSSSFVWSN